MPALHKAQAESRESMKTISEQAGVGSSGEVIDLAAPTTPRSVARRVRRIPIRVGGKVRVVDGDAEHLPRDRSDEDIGNAVGHSMDAGLLAGGQQLNLSQVRDALGRYDAVIESIAYVAGEAVELANTTPARSATTAPARPPRRPTTTTRSTPMQRRDPLSPVLYRNEPESDLDLSVPAGEAGSAPVDDDVRRYGPRLDLGALAAASSSEVLAHFKANHPGEFRTPFSDASPEWRAELDRNSEYRPHHAGQGFNSDGSQKLHAQQPADAYEDADLLFRRPGESEVDRTNRVLARDRGRGEMDAAQKWAREHARASIAGYLH